MEVNAVFFSVARIMQTPVIQAGCYDYILQCLGSWGSAVISYQDNNY